MIPRKPHFKQANPRMQLCALIQAAQGSIDNIAKYGIGHLSRAIISLKEAQELLRQMPDGEWQGEVCKICNRVPLDPKAHTHCCGICERKCRKNETLDKGKCFNCGGEWSETIMVRKTPPKTKLGE
jgi:hypothetical protein